jgi:hypothetical protein
MKKWLFAGVTVLCVSALATRVTLANRGDDGKVSLRATLLGAREVPPINSEGTGRFSATIDRDGTITFKVTFADLSSNLVVSHIHFAQFNVAGGVMIFLCGGGAQPACPAATSGEYEGTITPANVVGPAAQGITAGDLASALKVIGDGEGYTNLHTTRFPGGEIRGQIRVHGNIDDND